MRERPESKSFDPFDNLRACRLRTLRELEGPLRRIVLKGKSLSRIIRARGHIPTDS
jgi:hypothetical protein